jgi:hypothetical protein
VGNPKAVDVLSYRSSTLRFMMKIVSKFAKVRCAAPQHATSSSVNTAGVGHAEGVARSDIKHKLA